MEADIFFHHKMHHYGEVSSTCLNCHCDSLSGGVQSECFTEENTCMTSSGDNRVSIPPKRSGIGLSDDRSCVSSQQLAFHSFCVFYWFFCWKPVHKTYMYPLSDFVQEYSFSVFLAA